VRVLGCLAIATVVALAGASSAGADPVPLSVTASPSTGLIDGQTVSVTANGFIASTTPAGTVVPGSRLTGSFDLVVPNCRRPDPGDAVPSRQSKWGSVRSMNVGGEAIMSR
jgi:hypothetical protein